MKTLDNGKVCVYCDHCGKKLILEDDEKYTFSTLKNHNWLFWWNSKSNRWSNYCSLICKEYKQDIYRELNE